MSTARGQHHSTARSTAPADITRRAPHDQSVIIGRTAQDDLSTAGRHASVARSERSSGSCCGPPTLCLPAVHGCSGLIRAVASTAALRWHTVPLALCASNRHTAAAVLALCAPRLLTLICSNLNRTLIADPFTPRPRRDLDSLPLTVPTVDPPLPPLLCPLALRCTLDCTTKRRSVMS